MAARAPFPSGAFVARIEQAECNLIRSAVSAVRQRADSECFIESVAGGVATYAGPDSPLNKVVGLGFAQPITSEDLARIEARFAAVRAPVQVELSSLANPQVGEFLTGRGYRLLAVENILGRSISDADAAATPASSAIAVAHADQIEAWLSTLIDGFSVPDSGIVAPHDDFPRHVLERVLRDMGAAAGVLRYVVTLNGETAGAASMRLDGDIAQLSGSATRAEFRRRGVQTALLAARLAEAARNGCNVAVVTTQPGSTSHGNVHKAGFELLYVRSILRREAAAH